MRRPSWHAWAALHTLRGWPGRQASRCVSLEHRPTQASPAPPPSSAAAGSLAAAAAAKAKGVAELRRRLLLMCRLLLTAAAYNQARRREPCRMLHGVVVGSHV